MFSRQQQMLKAQTVHLADLQEERRPYPDLACYGTLECSPLWYTLNGRRFYVRETAPKEACCFDDETGVQQLLQLVHPPVNSTVLSWVKSVEVFSIFAAYGVNFEPHLANIYRQTGLQRPLALVELFGVNINALGNDTLLHVVATRPACSSDVSDTKALLAAGADPRIRDCFGFTPAERAVTVEGKYAVWKLLERPETRSFQPARIPPLLEADHLTDLVIPEMTEEQIAAEDGC